MLVLSRKRLESVVVGGAVGFERLLKVTVLEFKAAACDSASRSIRPFLSIVGRCGNEIRAAGQARQSSGGPRGAGGLIRT